LSNSTIGLFVARHGRPALLLYKVSFLFPVPGELTPRFSMSLFYPALARQAVLSNIEQFCKELL